jgi:hypothetical protein
MSSLVIRVDWETAEVRALMAKLQHGLKHSSQEKGRIQLCGLVMT